MKIRDLAHYLMLLVEAGLLAALALWPVFSSFSLADRVPTCVGDVFRFRFAKGQDELLKKVTGFRFYYKTKASSELSEDQVFTAEINEANPYDDYIVNLPPGMLTFRMDFSIRKDVENRDLHPVFEMVEISRRITKSHDFSPFYLQDFKIPGYMYDYRPILNGWLPEYIYCTVGLWLMLAVGVSFVIYRMKRERENSKSTVQCK